MGGVVKAIRGPGPRLSLRVRLTLWVVVIFTLIQWVTGGVFWLYQRAALQRVVDLALTDRVRAIAEEIAPDLPEIGDFELILVTRRLRHTEFGQFYLEVFDAQGRSALEHPTMRVTVEDLPIAEALASDEPILAEIMLRDEPGSEQPRGVQSWPAPALQESARARAVLFATNDHLGDRYAVVLVATDEFTRSQLELVARVLLLAAVVGPIAAAVSGWFIAGIAVAPFERLRAVAERLGPDTMDAAIDFNATNAEVARLASELDDARERMRRAFAAQERFLSNVSHEIKTPIAVMLAESQTLPASSMTPEFREYVASVQEEMVRLGSLVESFLTLSRVRDGKELVHARSYAVNDLVMDSVERCLMMAHQHRVTLVPHLIGGEDGMDVRVRGEPDLLCTMLDNLVRNAIRFSPDDARVRIVAECDDRAASVAVEDEGPGIPPDRLERVFDRFSQSEPGLRSGRGHGLGLAIAQGVAELHGGTIIAENRPEGGCRFTVTLPVERDSSCG